MDFIAFLLRTPVVICFIYNCEKILLRRVVVAVVPSYCRSFHSMELHELMRCALTLTKMRTNIWRWHSPTQFLSRGLVTRSVYHRKYRLKVSTWKRWYSESDAVTKDKIENSLIMRFTYYYLSSRCDSRPTTSLALLFLFSTSLPSVR